MTMTIRADEYLGRRGEVLWYVGFSVGALCCSYWGEPGGVGAAGDEGGFEGAMEALDHDVGFGVVGRCVVIC